MKNILHWALLGFLGYLLYSTVTEEEAGWSAALGFSLGITVMSMVWVAVDESMKK